MQIDAIERLAAAANGDAWLVHRGRHLDTTFLLGVGDTDYLVRIHRGRVEAVDKGPFVQPRWTFALQGIAGGLGYVLAAAAAARRPRPDRHDQDQGAAAGGRPVSLHGQSALLQGPAGAAARRSPRKRREAHDELRKARIRARRRPLPARRHRRQDASHLRRAGGRRHPARLPAHGRRGRPAISRPHERCRDAGPLPRHRLRPAVARQVLAAGGVAGGRVQAHLARLRRHHHGRHRRARPRQAGGDGLLHRRAHRAAPGAGACRRASAPSSAWSPVPTPSPTTISTGCTAPTCTAGRCAAP